MQFVAVNWLFFTGKLPGDPIGRVVTTANYARRIVFEDEQSSYGRRSRWYFTAPPRIVYSTSADMISDSGTVIMSFVNTTMSASLPTLIEPRSCSWNAAYALLSV